MANSNREMRASEMRRLSGVECLLDGDAVYVARADREVGITLRRVDNDEEAYCINRAQILNHLRSVDKLRQYHEAFSVVVKMVLEGEVRNIAFNAIGGWHYNTAFSLLTIRCAF